MRSFDGAEARIVYMYYAVGGGDQEMGEIDMV